MKNEFCHRVTTKTFGGETKVSKFFSLEDAKNKYAELDAREGEFRMIHLAENCTNTYQVEFSEEQRVMLHKATSLLLEHTDVIDDELEMMISMLEKMPEDERETPLTIHGLCL